MKKKRDSKNSSGSQKCKLLLFDSSNYLGRTRMVEAWFQIEIADPIHTTNQGQTGTLVFLYKPVQSFIITPKYGICHLWNPPLNKVYWVLRPKPLKCVVPTMNITCHISIYIKAVIEQPRMNWCYTKRRFAYSNSITWSLILLNLLD